MSDDDLIFRARNPQPGTRSPSAAVDSVWTLPILCLGIGIIACCILVPASDVNRKLVLERAKLQRDLEAVDKQIQVNDQFLKLAGSDPELAERLAQRQMKLIRPGTHVLQLPNQPGSTHSAEQMSPFLLTAMPGAAPMANIPPRKGLLGKLSGDSKLQLYAIGAGLLLLAIGLVLSGSTPPSNLPRA